MRNSSIVQYCKKNDSSIKPKYTSKGYELYSAIKIKIEARKATCVPLGFSMKLLKEYCGIIVSYKHRVLGGVIDSDSRGEIKVILCPDEEVYLERGEIVALMHILEIAHPTILEENSNNLIN